MGSVDFSAGQVLPTRPDHKLQGQAGTRLKAGEEEWAAGTLFPVQPLGHVTPTVTRATWRQES